MSLTSARDLNTNGLTVSQLHELFYKAMRLVQHCTACPIRGLKSSGNFFAFNDGLGFLVWLLAFLHY